MGAKWKIKAFPTPVVGQPIVGWLWIAVGPSLRGGVEHMIVGSWAEALGYVNEQLDAGALAEATA